ncbi:MAG: hypothetical protein RQ885_12390 [Desulfurococcales archaeon]|jgi:hypothetical protein|nr:hypothetical protein [Desulfurococcales archaeon]
MDLGDEYIDVHEGGELSWMQKISDMVKIYGHRIEAHGDAARIVLNNISIDIGPFEGKICLQAHLELPVSHSSGIQLEDLVERVEKVYRTIYSIDGPLTYVLDDSLGDLSLIHILRCYEKPDNLIRDLEAIFKTLP